jgi:hypothetical protein
VRRREAAQHRAPDVLSLPLAFAFALAEPNDVPKREAGAQSSGGAALSLKPRGVPSGAAPASGAPVPLQIEDDDEEDEEEAPLVTDPVNNDPIDALEPFVPTRVGHPMSAFTRTPKPGVRPGGRKKKPRKRDPNHRMLPLPHISSQPATGLTLGGSLNYSYRRPGEEFNRMYLLAWSRVSTRGVQDHIVSGRLRDMLGRKEVIQFGGIIAFDPVYPFYGINNHENLAGTDLTGPYNRIEMDNFGVWFSYEHPLWLLHRPNRPVGTLRQYTGAMYYVDVVTPHANSRMTDDYPQLPGTYRRGILRGGLTWDSRDNDWSPTQGSLVDVLFEAAGKYTGSTSGWGRMHTTVRHFWPLGHSGFVFAHRVTLDTLFGAPPLQTLGELGGLFPMDAYGGAFIGRGFARRRFIGNMKAAAAAEIRFAPLEFKIGRSKLGVGFEGFFELGMVSMKIADLFKTWYPSGGPGVLLIWNRFVVFRVEAGFSREGGAIYLQSEHAF